MGANEFRDPINDQLFPNRPDHPDFWAMVDATNYLDGQASEGEVSPPDIVKEYVDVESLLYIVNQRVLRGAQVRPDILLDTDLRAMCMALYVDAFALASRFAEMKGE